jgi:hypothetical protein
MSYCETGRAPFWCKEWSARGTSGLNDSATGGGALAHEAR